MISKELRTFIDLLFRSVLCLQTKFFEIENTLLISRSSDIHFHLKIKIKYIIEQI